MWYWIQEQGYCEFINNIHCKVKYTVDLNKEITKFASEEIQIYQADCTNLSCTGKNEAIDVVLQSKVKNLRNEINCNYSHL